MNLEEGLQIKFPRVWSLIFLIKSGKHERWKYYLEEKVTSKKPWWWRIEEERKNTEVTVELNNLRWSKINEKETSLCCQLIIQCSSICRHDEKGLFFKTTRCSEISWSFKFWTMNNGKLYSKMYSFILV